MHRNPLHPALRTRKTIPLFLTLAVAGSAHAGFSYNPRDLVFGFRQDGGNSELVINAGPASQFYSLPVGSTLTIANLTHYLLTNSFPNLNDLYWSGAADVRTNGDASYPIQTLWVIRPRDDVNTQTTPWNRQSQTAQGNVGGKVDGVANGAVNYGGIAPSGPDNATTGIIIPGGNQYAYSTFMGSAGNYKGTFQGNVEVLTPSDFADAGQPIRADFYQLKPGSGAGTYLGYFQFNTNGVLTYTAGASTVNVPRPTITFADRSGNTSTISFTTVGGAQYSLRYTNSAGLSTPVSLWPTSGSPVAGDGSEKSLSDTSGDAIRFYSISAH